MPSEKPKEEKIVKYIFLTLTVLLIFFAFVLYRESRPPEEEERLTDDSLIRETLKSAPRFGATDPEIILLEFGDFQCPSCKVVTTVIKETLKNYPEKVQLAWIHLPNTIDHPRAVQAAKAAQCAAEQGKFWLYHDELFAQQNNLSPQLYRQIAQAFDLNMQDFENCLTSEQVTDIIKLHQQFAQRAEIRSTPTMMINDQTISGEFTSEELNAFIERSLQITASKNEE